MNNENKWNAMVSSIVETDFPSGDEEKDNQYLMFQYYSFMESGGHESLFNTFEEYIREIGSEHFVEKLLFALRSIGADAFVDIEHRYANDLLEDYLAMSDGDEQAEKRFYRNVEEADGAYHRQQPAFEQVIQENYLEG